MQHRYIQWNQANPQTQILETPNSIATTGLWPTTKTENTSQLLLIKRTTTHFYTIHTQPP